MSFRCSLGHITPVKLTWDYALISQKVISKVDSTRFNCCVKRTNSVQK